MAFLLPSVLLWVHFYQPGGVDRSNSDVCFIIEYVQVSADSFDSFEIVGALPAATGRCLELCCGAPRATAECQQRAHIHS